MTYNPDRDNGLKAYRNARQLTKAEVISIRGTEPVESSALVVDDQGTETEPMDPEFLGYANLVHVVNPSSSTGGTATDTTALEAKMDALIASNALAISLDPSNHQTIKDTTTADVVYTATSLIGSLKSDAVWKLTKTNSLTGEVFVGIAGSDYSTNYGFAHAINTAWTSNTFINE